MSPGHGPAVRGPAARGLRGVLGAIGALMWTLLALSGLGAATAGTTATPAERAWYDPPPQALHPQYQRILRPVLGELVSSAAALAPDGLESGPHRPRDVTLFVVNLAQASAALNLDCAATPYRSLCALSFDCLTDPVRRVVACDSALFDSMAVVLPAEGVDQDQILRFRSLVMTERPASTWETWDVRGPGSALREMAAAVLAHEVGHLLQGAGGRLSPERQTMEQLCANRTATRTVEAEADRWAMRLMTARNEAPSDNDLGQTRWSSMPAYLFQSWAHAIGGPGLFEWLLSKSETTPTNTESLAERFAPTTHPNMERRGLVFLAQMHAAASLDEAFVVNAFMTWAPDSAVLGAAVLEAGCKGMGPSEVTQGLIDGLQAGELSWVTVARRDDFGDLAIDTLRHGVETQTLPDAMHVLPGLVADVAERMDEGDLPPIRKVARELREMVRHEHSPEAQMIRLFAYAFFRATFDIDSAIGTMLEFSLDASSMNAARRQGDLIVYDFYGRGFLEGESSFDDAVKRWQTALCGAVEARDTRRPPAAARRLLQYALDLTREKGLPTDPCVAKAINGLRPYWTMRSLKDLSNFSGSLETVSFLDAVSKAEEVFWSSWDEGRQDLALAEVLALSEGLQRSQVWPVARDLLTLAATTSESDASPLASLAWLSLSREEFREELIGGIPVDWSSTLNHALELSDTAEGPVQVQLLLSALELTAVAGDADAGELIDRVLSNSPSDFARLRLVRAACISGLRLGSPVSEDVTRNLATLPDLPAVEEESAVFLAAVVEEGHLFPDPVRDLLLRHLRTGEVEPLRAACPARP